MRILLINDGASPHTGGMNRVVVETCDRLVHSGHDVALAYHDEQPVTVGCRVFHVREAWPVAQRCEELLRAVAEFRPDVVQNHSSKILPALGPMSERVPTCIFLHDQSWFCSSLDRMAGDYTPCHRPHDGRCLFWHYAQGCGGRDPRGNWARWRHIGERIAIRELRRLRVQVASQFMKQGLLENRFPDERLDVVPLFAEPATTKLPTEPGLLLLPSRLVPAKGVHVALEAVALLHDLPWRLVIAGDGPQRSELQQLAARLGIEGRVEFTGEIPPAKLESWFARAAVVLFPVLRPEPFGLIGVEALAHSKPVVAFDGGAVEEWLWPGETGVLVKQRTAEAFAAGLREVLENPDRAPAMAAAAGTRYPTFHPSSFVERLTDAFHRAQAWFRQTA